MVGENADSVWGVVDVLCHTNFPDVRCCCTVQSAKAGTLKVNFDEISWKIFDNALFFSMKIHIKNIDQFFVNRNIMENLRLG